LKHFFSWPVAPQARQSGTGLARVKDMTAPSTKRPIWVMIFEPLRDARIAKNV
jgi:hypothetical protein